jgi:hypothetical protein
VVDYRDFRLEGQDRLHLGQVTRNGVLIDVDDVFSSVVLLLRRLPRPHHQLTISISNNTLPPMNPSATWLLAVVQNRVYFSYFLFVVFLFLFT